MIEPLSILAHVFDVNFWEKRLEITFENNISKMIVLMLLYLFFIPVPFQIN